MQKYSYGKGSSSPKRITGSNNVIIKMDFQVAMTLIREDVDKSHPMKHVIEEYYGIKIF